MYSSGNIFFNNIIETKSFYTITFSDACIMFAGIYVNHLSNQKTTCFDKQYTLKMNMSDKFINVFVGVEGSKLNYIKYFIRQKTHLYFIIKATVLIHYACVTSRTMCDDCT